MKKEVATTNIRIYPSTYERLKAKANRKKKTLVLLVDELSKK